MVDVDLSVHHSLGDAFASLLALTIVKEDGIKLAFEKDSLNGKSIAAAFILHLAQNALVLSLHELEMIELVHVFDKVGMLIRIIARVQTGSQAGQVAVERASWIGVGDTDHERVSVCRAEGRRRPWALESGQQVVVPEAHHDILGSVQDNGTQVVGFPHPHHRLFHHDESGVFVQNHATVKVYACHASSKEIGVADKHDVLVFPWVLKELAKARIVL